MFQKDECQAEVQKEEIVRVGVRAEEHQEECQAGDRVEFQVEEHQEE